MRPHRFLIALVAFFALIAVLPLWTVIDLGNFTPTNRFIAGIVFPAFVLMYISSWIKPDLAAPLLGLFVLVGVVALFPTIFGFVTIGSNELTDNPMMQVVIQLVVPVLLVIFIATMASRRFI